MNRREQIEMTQEEAEAFLLERKVAVVTSFGPRGWPHSMPLWYVPNGDRIRSWTFAKSQKVKNLERDPCATVLVEDGYDNYSELRGVMMETETLIHRDPNLVTAYAESSVARYTPEGVELTTEMLEAFRSQAPKRVVLEFIPVRVLTWDHRKLGGTY